jgi:hypothetical protein
VAYKGTGGFVEYSDPANSVRRYTTQTWSGTAAGSIAISFTDTFSSKIPSGGYIGVDQTGAANTFAWWNPNPFFAKPVWNTADPPAVIGVNFDANPAAAPFGGSWTVASPTERTFDNTGQEPWGVDTPTTLTATLSGLVDHGADYTIALAMLPTLESRFGSNWSCDSTPLNLPEYYKDEYEGTYAPYLYIIPGQIPVGAAHDYAYPDPFYGQGHVTDLRNPDDATLWYYAGTTWARSPSLLSQSCWHGANIGPGHSYRGGSPSGGVYSGWDYSGMPISPNDSGFYLRVIKSQFKVGADSPCWFGKIVVQQDGSGANVIQVLSRFTAAAETPYDIPLPTEAPAADGLLSVKVFAFQNIAPEDIPTLWPGWSVGDARDAAAEAAKEQVDSSRSTGSGDKIG